ncbi:hypothetical protein M1413_01835 [Patescibacteria group bacterium]|nr:hypothetical protein [Patescibacteria group bacterium]MCL5114421.1 hypothetical protein [Patescibacteria group bacterium]
MSSRKEVCQNCRREFIIEPEDLAFYERIKVPPPTFCPECRFRRRLSFMNVVNLYKRKCDLCGKETISVYAPDAPYRVFCVPCWFSDRWDPLAYGRDYDFSRPFFEQFREFLSEAPLPALSTDFMTLKTSPYTHLSGNNKNVYMLFHADFDEDSAYGFYATNSKSVFDSSLIMNSELCYDSMHAYRCNRCAGLRGQVTESIDSYFLKYCWGCQNCFASINLRNKKYYIFNKPYAKEDYFKEIKKWDLGSYREYREIQKLAEEHWKKFPPKPVFDEFTENCTGNNVFQSRNCKECYEVLGAENSKYLSMLYLPGTRDSYDITSWGNNLTLSYDSPNVGENASEVKFNYGSGLNLMDSEYSFLIYGGAHVFGCVSLKKKEYCILNKQYTKEEYEVLIPKIKSHMDEMPYTDQKGRVYTYGEFFPVEMSTFSYNETLAQNFFPLTEDAARAEGYGWRNIEKKEYEVTKKAADLPDHIKDAPDDLLNEIIGCAKCGRGFRLIRDELEFLRKMNYPLPRECPFCRIDEKIDQWVDNLKMEKRACSKCGAEFMTSISNHDAQNILCKKCYSELTA